MQPQTAEPPIALSKRRHPLVTALLIVLAMIFIFLIALVGMIEMQPDTFRLERSQKMMAPPEAVFAQVNDFHNWQAWSPWAKLDPNATNTYSGAESGRGAKFAWNGNDEVGAGELEIVESKPNELIKMKLSFLRPMENTCDTVFSFRPEDGGTLMTWSMEGPNSFLGKALHLVIDMDAMVGAQFEEGLTSIQQIVEQKPAP
jgi:hypothetical protein